MDKKPITVPILWGGTAKLTSYVPVIEYPFALPPGLRLEGLKDGEWRLVGENRTDASLTVMVRVGENVSAGEDHMVRVRLSALSDS